MANRQFKRQQKKHDYQHGKAEGKGVTPLMMFVMVVLAMAAVGATMGTAPVDAAATVSAIQVVARATVATVAAIGCGLATMAERALKPGTGHYPSVYPPNPAAELELEPEVRFKTDDEHVKFQDFEILKVAAAGLSSSSGPEPAPAARLEKIGGPWPDKSEGRADPH